MADSQDIEAKLAAYVDGELPADARTEIEKYLSANPKQRRLIADLMRQRDLLQALPKNAAPADVAESLNAQLERAVLLGDVDAEATAGSIRPWRNVAGIAAVLLLVAGLALTIYSLLPSPNRKPKDLASVTSIPASQPVDKDFASDFAAAPTTQLAVSEQEQRARGALNPRDPSVAAAVERPMPSLSNTTVAPDRAETPTPMMDAVNAELPAAPTTAPFSVPLEPIEVASIEIPTPDAAATRQQVINTLTALGARVATTPNVITAPSDSVVALEVEPKQLDQALAVAKSFQPTSMKPASSNGAATQLSANENNSRYEINSAGSNAASQANGIGGQYQNQATMNQQLADAAPPVPPLPAERLTVRLLTKAAATQPTTAPSTQPTSSPATEPATQP